MVKQLEGTMTHFRCWPTGFLLAGLRSTKCSLSREVGHCPEENRFLLYSFYLIYYLICVCTRECACHVVCVCVVQKTTSGGSFLLLFWELNSGCWSHPEALWPTEASRWLHVRSFMIEQLVRRKHAFMRCFWQKVLLCSPVWLQTVLSLPQASLCWDYRYATQLVAS